MLSYFTILKHHFTIIPYHFPISSTSQNSIFIKILFFNHSLLFIPTAIYFQIAGNFFIFFIFFPLSLPCSLSLSRYIFSDCWNFFIFFIFFSLSLPCSLSLSRYIFQIVGTSSFFSLSLPCSLSLSLCPSISLSLCLTASQVCGSLWCLLGVAGRWIVGLCGGS